ncbi:hypothetical protein PMAYCL1PPCAC_23417, partial [Pristionchus mayeri]
YHSGNMQEDLLEAFRAPLFFVYMSMLLSFCMVSGAELGDRVELEFQAYRLQQYEVSGSIIGSKSFRILYEAVGIDANALRKSVVVSWRDLMNRDLDGLFKTAVGSMIIVLPADFADLSPAERKQLLDLETALSMVQTELAVYAIKWSEAAAALLSDVSATSTASTGTQKLVQAISANTFQLSSTTTSIPASIPFTPKNVVVRLAGGIPTASTIVFLAHYDTHSAFPDLGVGSDSNGSGMVALLELLSVFKRFYDSAATKPNNHMIFAWTAAGKHNYQGSAAFLAEMQEKYADDKVDLVVCLDTIGNGKALNVHLSKIPSSGTVSDRFVSHLRAAAHNQTIDVVAKKINMQLPFSWEHERFNAKRQAALTLSGLSVPSEISRRSISDSSLDSSVLTRNIRTIAEATLSMILPLPERASHKDERVTSDSTLLSPEAVSMKRVNLLISRFASRPRPLSSQSATEETVANLMAYASSYGHARVQPVTNLETVVVPSNVERIVAEKTKPAIFDLFLAAGIAVYLAAFTKIASCSQVILDRSLTTLRKGY